MTVRCSGYVVSSSTAYRYDELAVRDLGVNDRVKLPSCVRLKFPTWRWRGLIKIDFLLTLDLGILPGSRNDLIHDPSLGASSQ